MRVDEGYRLKGIPKLNDRPWGWDTDLGKNTTWTLEGMLRAGGVLNSAIDVRMYGAVGDGENDDTAAIQLALGAAAGRWVNFPPELNYKLTAALNVPVGSNIIGYGARIFCDTHIHLMNVNGNTVIKGLELEGAGSETPNDLGRGINMVGSVGDYKANLTLEDVYVHNVGYYGVYLQFVENFKVLKSRVHNIGYGGIFGLSVSKGQVDKCWVKGLTGDSGAYNISFTRATTVNTLEANPRSQDVDVTFCLAEDNLTWKALDTHGGENINFYGCTVRNCKQGIGIVGSGPNVTGFAPKNCKVIGNFVFGLKEDYGIAVAGILGASNAASGDAAANITVQGNYLQDCGLPNNNNYGAIRCRDTKGLKLEGNNILEPIPHGIVLINTNLDFSVCNNTIRDSNDADFATPAGIVITSTFNKGLISGNSIAKENGALNTYVGVRGIWLNTQTDNSIALGINYITYDNTVVNMQGSAVKYHNFLQGVDMYSVLATPEGSVAASVGSLAINTNGGALTTLFVKESGTGNTGWKGVVTTTYIGTGASQIQLNSQNDVKFLQKSGDAMSGQLTMNITPSTGARALLFNHSYAWWFDNTGPGSTNTRAWFDGPAGATVYMGPRSGGRFHLIDLNADTIQAYSIKTLKPNDTVLANAFRIGDVSSGTITPDRKVRIQVGNLVLDLDAQLITTL